jgi:hypothetical protein
MIRKISCEISNNSAYEIIVEMFGFGVGAYYVVNA